MTNPFELDGPRFGPAAGGDARELVILLHGLGADGHDLISLAPYFANTLRHAAFVSPHAPFPCDMAPFGRQWFSLQDQSPRALLAGARMAAPFLDSFIDLELSRAGVGEDRLALVGFSQGAMMALHVALRRDAACAGIVGYSGLLIGPEVLTSEIKSRPPVLLIHGEADELIPARALRAAVTALQAIRVRVTSELRPGLAHGIDERGIALGGEFLKQVFAA